MDAEGTSGLSDLQMSLCNGMIPACHLSNRVTMLHADALATLELDPQKEHDESEIKKAYIRLARLHHPDKHPGASDAEKEATTARFQAIAAAYQFLNSPLASQAASSNAVEKSAYDLYEKCCGEKYDEATASAFNFENLRYCGLFANSLCKANEIKFCIEAEYERGIAPGKKGVCSTASIISFRGVEHFKDWLHLELSSVPPNAITMTFEIYKSNLPAEGHEVLVAILASATQLSTIKAPPDFFTPEQQQRIDNRLITFAETPAALSPLKAIS